MSGRVQLAYYKAGEKKRVSLQLVGNTTYPRHRERTPS
jgi:hypothetical protein